MHYPGLKSHPDHAVAARQMTGFGGVVSFEVQGDLWSAAKLVDSLRLPYMAPSLGGVECLVEQPAIIRWGGHLKILLQPNLPNLGGNQQGCSWEGGVPGGAAGGDQVRLRLGWDNAH